MKIRGNSIKIHPIFIFIIVFLFAVMTGKMVYVALNDVIDGKNIRELADSRTTNTEVIEATRGSIFDNQGNTLAQNINSYTIIAYLSSKRTTNPENQKHVTDFDGTAKALCSILAPSDDKCYDFIYGRLTQTGLYQTELGNYGKNITETTKQKIEKLDLPGIDFSKTFKRYYQNGNFASYIIGYAKKYTDEKTGDMELIGELGIEGFCDRYLKGTNGSITYQQDAYGYQMADKVYYETPAKDGYDIYLTLDKQIQIFLDDAVNKFKEYDPSWVTITVADAKTGAIIGSATDPSFDPNTMIFTSDTPNYNNPLTSYTYEPGSTMKTFSFMSAMEEGLYNGSELYQSGNIKVDDYTISDWNTTGWGAITYDTGFTYSSNVAAVNLVQKLGRQKLHDYYEKLGFGSKTGIELSNEYSGDISFEYASELASASYGQGITVTPIQMIQALTTLTNDGTMLKPYIIQKIVNHDTGEVEYEGKRTEVRKIYSTDTVSKITELMDRTVNGDDPAITGKYYHTDAVRVIGKTGTSNYTDETGKYVEGDRYVIRSFAGVFPKEDPEYIIYVAVKDFNGKSKPMGDIVKSLIESVAKYKNLDERESDKDDSKIVTLSNYYNKSLITVSNDLSNLGITPIIIGDGSTVTKTVPEKNTTISVNSKVFVITNGSNITMPDITNWSSKDVIDYCNIIGLKYETNGYGYVSSYSIPAGTVLTDINNLVLSVELTSIEPESLTDEVVSNGT